MNGSLENLSPFIYPCPTQAQAPCPALPSPRMAGNHLLEAGMSTPPRTDGLLPKLPRSAATLLCHLPPSEVTFSRASFLFQPIPARFPGAQAWQSFIKASLSSLCFGDIVLWISPPRSTFVQTIGENAGIFILKNKSSRSSSHRERKQGTNYTP